MSVTKTQVKKLQIVRESLVKEREQKIHEHEIRLEAGDNTGAEKLLSAINILTDKINDIDEQTGA